MAYNRIYAVDIEADDGKFHRLTGVDIKFRVEYSLSAVLTEATISICNLTRSDIEFLTTYTSRWVNTERRKRIRLFAGYSDQPPLNMIFDGDILDAIPTDPPDVWLNISAIVGGWTSIETISKSVLVKSPIKTICEQAASWFGKTLDWRATSTKQLSGFDFSGGFNQLIQRLNDLDDVIVFFDDDKIVAVDRDSPQRNIKIHEVNEETGMVYLPKIDMVGAEIKTFLNTKFRRGDLINFTSKRVPIANGRYNILNVIHEGHFRGDAWWTTIKTRRENLYVK